MMKKALFAAAATVALAGGAAAEDYPDRLLWGDTHLHTRLSMDAYALGNRSGDADMAYRFARGEPVIHPYHRARVQLQTPLDFLAVADHAELLGAPYSLIELKDPRLTETRVGKRIVNLIRAGKGVEAFGLIVLGGNLSEMKDEDRPKKIGIATALAWRFQDLVSVPKKRARAERWLASDPSLMQDLSNPDVARAMWALNLDAATKHNDPGRFTTLVGWEFSSTPDGANLHRIILSPTDPENAKKFIPYSSVESRNPEDLWRWLDKTKKETGADFLTIPHNSNISKGQMFAEVDFEGRPIDGDYARLRTSWETIAEVTQIKGTSETRPELSPTDEFADFEFYDKLIESRPDAPKIGTITNGDYVRGALKRGLEIENKIGINPFKLGMIGATDAHTGLPSAEENNFPGKFVGDSIPEQKENSSGRGSGWTASTSGLAAVWARDNTREEIFAAMKRREVYGTTGPRIAVRFFGGFDFAIGDENADNIAAIGYQKGVPMGGDLTAADGKAPTFLIRAVKDPKDGNLDRIQIVKGWLGADGAAQEKVYDIAWAGDRAPGPDGKLPPVGDTVDVASANYSNTIGAGELSAVWSDPEFNAGQKAFYYVRVLQIPTPRNSTFDSVALQKPPPAGFPTSIQERAYSSPIWYSPAKS